MGKAKSVPDLTLLSTVLMELDSVLLPFSPFLRSGHIYTLLCSKNTYSVTFFTAMPLAFECCKKATLSGGLACPPGLLMDNARLNSLSLGTFKGSSAWAAETT